MKEIKLLMFGVALMSLLVTVTCQEVEMFDTTGFLEDYIDKVLRFNPGNVSFYKLPELILNQLGVEHLKIPGDQLAKHSECALLPMDPEQKYTVLKTFSGKGGQLTGAEIKPPFSNIVTINSLVIGKRFCVAFNRKNYGVGFEILQAVPCMSSSLHDCGLKVICYLSICLVVNGA